MGRKFRINNIKLNQLENGDWYKYLGQLHNIDIKTQKLLTSLGSVHINSDIDRLYSYRNKDGEGFNSLVDINMSRLVSINSYLTEKSLCNTYLALAFNHEKESPVRVANQFIQCFNIQAEPNEPPKKLLFKINQKVKENHLLTWLKKPQHGYLFQSRDYSNQVND